MPNFHSELALGAPNESGGWQNCVHSTLNLARAIWVLNPMVYLCVAWLPLLKLLLLFFFFSAPSSMDHKFLNSICGQQSLEARWVLMLRAEFASKRNMGPKVLEGFWGPRWGQIGFGGQSGGRFEPFEPAKLAHANSRGLLNGHVRQRGLPSPFRCALIEATRTSAPPGDASSLIRCDCLFWSV